MSSTVGRGKIFYLGGFELPDKNAAAHRVVANGKILRDLGFEVVFVGVDSSRTAGGLKRYESRYFGFECWSVPYPTSSRAWLSHIVGPAQILDYLKNQLKNGTAGVICYNYPALAQLRIQAICRGFGVKQLADSTEWYDSSAGSFTYRLIKSLDTIMRMRFVHNRADGVITTSQFMSSFYINYRKLVVELPTLFDTDSFMPPLARDGGAVKRFVYVGSPFNSERINADRSNLKERLDLAIELFYRLHCQGHDFQFDIYGIHTAPYLEVFPEHAEILRELAAKVFFHGKQSNTSVLACISKSDFSIFFRDETRVTLAGFPSKAAESISCGTPVITNEMKSLERYRMNTGLFLAKKGEEFSVLEQLNRIPVDKMESIKLDTYNSRAFDYRKYKEDVCIFLRNVGVK